MFLLLVASGCSVTRVDTAVRGGDSTAVRGGDSTADSAVDPAVDSAVDSASSAPGPVGDSGAGPVTWACPTGMVGIPTESPAWCIDPYEDTLDGATVTSQAGVLPTVGVTYLEAAAACAGMPARDDTGAVYAMRHLATAEEWEDAGDGVVGDGGTAYPWGDTFDDSVCVTLTEDGVEQFDGLQLTGSLPGCVSTFGVYDQVGNAWEWADSGVLLDVAGALATFTTAGIAVSVDDDGAIVVAADGAALLHVEAAGLQPSTVRAEADGHLYVDVSQIQTSLGSFFARGYLMKDESTAGMLPVRLASTDAADATAPWRLYLADEYDGLPLPDKRGCAWYTGTSHACTLATASYAHLPDFDGTIGFRCAAPPFAR